MDRYRLLRIQEQVRSGEISPLEASVVFQDLQTEDLGYASVDHHRALRLGFPEVIFGEGKTVEQIRGIFNSLRARQDIVSITRVDDEKGARLMQQAPELPHNRLARTLLYTAREPEIRGRGTVLVVYAGSSDLPVAEEAKVTAYALGNRGDSSAHIGWIGASFGGLAALLGMLNSCAPGVVVVNIDNGFGAAYAASIINRRHPAQ